MYGNLYREQKKERQRDRQREQNTSPNMQMDRNDAIEAFNSFNSISQRPGKDSPSCSAWIAEADRAVSLMLTQGFHSQPV